METFIVQNTLQLAQLLLDPNYKALRLHYKEQNQSTNNDMLPNSINKTSHQLQRETRATWKQGALHSRQQFLVCYAARTL